MNLTQMILFGLFSALFGTSCSAQTGVKQMAINDLPENLEEGVLLDVRTQGEVNQGYIDVPGVLFSDVLNQAAFKESLTDLDKDKTYYIYCRSGARSMKAAKIMIDLGFTDVYNLQGGFNAWKGKSKRP